LNRYRLKKGYHNSQKKSNKSDELNHDNIGTVEPKTNAIRPESGDNGVTGGAGGNAGSPCGRIACRSAHKL